MKLTVQEMSTDANLVIETISVRDALAEIDAADVAFVDVRDVSERIEAGEIPGAVSAPRGFLEFCADPATGMHNQVFASGRRLILFCASGGRSTLAAKTLVDMGVPNVAHMAGGFGAWKEAGGPIQATY